MQSIATTPTMLGSFFLSLLAISGSASTAQATVLCPGLPEQQYCDCSGDCTGFPEWCGCQEAQECCQMSSPVVLCPGQPRENYCDCDGDCTEQPDWCSCQQAEECCNGGVQADTFDEFMSPPTTVNIDWNSLNPSSFDFSTLVIAGWVVTFVFMLLAVVVFCRIHQRRNKHNDPHKSLSKANQSGNHDDGSDEATVVSDEEDVDGA
mmetsp:Transcript_52826/g.57327  ORF Transcript_52826/g.57327 Transcript_52826/m.57327 type:complete len:206 (+) Transcript_52826:259-876(+)